MAQHALDADQIIRSVYDPTNQALKIGNSPAPASAPADSTLNASELVFWMDEVADQLKVKVKLADGVTVQTGVVLDFSP
tara:strand:+ start:28 stop:264 length:237 start_codon:yes stop_codon:yes gene_type:complete